LAFNQVFLLHKILEIIANFHFCSQKEIGTVDFLMWPYYRLSFNEDDWLETAQEFNQEVIVCVIPYNFVRIKVADIYWKLT